MEKTVCEEKHKRIDEKFDTHERRLNNHGDRIDALEQHKSRTETQIENLINQIKSLVSTMKWFMGLMVATLLGFFIWYIQQLGR
ncbi:MAG TPA: hemolysin XhlA family protein [Massilibacterium sp.]|nr:hemolysin XhlA family protein [Massilibacterium sp.]